MQTFLRLVTAAAGCCVFLIVSSASATLVSFTASGKPSDNPDANGGTVDVWQVNHSTANTSQAGDFLGDSGNNGFGSGAGAGNEAWALYGNSGQEAKAEASIPTLAGVPLSFNGDYVSLDFDNGFVEAGGRVGVRFRDSANNTQAVFEFVHGSPSGYQLTDATTQTTGTDQPYTVDGFNIRLTLTSGTGDYSIEAGGFTQASTLQQGTSDISRIEVFNLNAGSGTERNVYFNNLEISIAAIPEPSAFLFGGLLTLASASGYCRRSRMRTARS